MSEASDTYIPAGYITNAGHLITEGTVRGLELRSGKPSVDIYACINDLEGIWKYAALDYHHNHPEATESKEATEYALTIIKMWDYLDKLDVDTIEQVIIELGARIIKNGEPLDKILHTQLEDYLEVRLLQL